MERDKERIKDRKMRLRAGFATDEYPTQISYEGPRNLGSFYPEFHDLVQKVMTGLRMTMIAENVIQIEYPSHLVWQIREVNVGDMTYRLDFLLRGHEESRVGFFPNVPWGHKNFFKNGRFCNGKRTTADGKIIIEYPKLED